MASEKGIVVRVDNNDTAWVKTVRTSACEACSARDSCQTLGGGEDIEVEALNPIHAQSGDRVVIGFESASLYKATFLIYMVPILSMLVGAVLGQQLGGKLGIDPSTLSTILGILFLVIAFVFIRLKSNQLAQKTAYKPVIMRVIKQ